VLDDESHQLANAAKNKRNAERTSIRADHSQHKFCTKAGAVTLNVLADEKAQNIETWFAVGMR
jgi:hypothetical protein